MQTSNDILNSRSAEPVWYLLAEFSLSKFLADHGKTDGLTAGYLPQAVKELGMPPESLENMTKTLTGFAKEARGHFKQRGVRLPGRIRVFCQNRLVDAAQSDHTEHATEPIQMILWPVVKMFGGWGYFLIERSGNVSAGSPARSGNSVDLYLYKEGE